MAVKFSVVVPAYNAAGTVATTLQSLLSQTVPPFEIVVVDDGSKDRTREALQPFADQVTLIFQENSGVSATRNRAVAETTGDWIVFCDADDVWHPDKLRIVSAVIEASPGNDLVFHDFWTVVDDRMVEPQATHSPNTTFPIFREEQVTLRDILPEHRVVETGAREFPAVQTYAGHAFRWMMLGSFLMPSTVAIRRSTFVSVGGFDPQFRYAEDTEFFLRLSKATSYLWIDCSLTGYRQAAGSLLTGNMYPTLRNAVRAVVKHCLDDPKVMAADPQWVSRAVARRFSRFAYYCLSELRMADAREYAWAALRLNWRDRRAWLVALAALLPAPALRAVRALKGRR